MVKAKKLKVAIIGSNGFIASNLIKELMDEPSIELLLCGSSPQNVSGYHDIYKCIDLFDKHAILTAFHDVDIVYYVKSATIPSSSWEDPLIEVQNNLIPFLTFLNAIVKLEIKKIVFISSGGAIYGETNDSIREDFDKLPISPYGITKLTIEHYLNYYYKKFNLNYDILRISNVYGFWPFSFRKFGLINTYLTEIGESKSVTVFGDGTIIRDYIYIKDLVKILKKLLIKIDINQNRILNISSGDCFSINEIIEYIQEVIRVDFSIKHTPSRDSDIQSIKLDNKRLLDTIGPFNFTSIQDGITETYNKIQNADRIK